MPGHRDMCAGRPQSRGCGRKSPGSLRASAEVRCGPPLRGLRGGRGGNPCIRRFWRIRAGGACPRSSIHDIRALVQRNPARERARAPALTTRLPPEIRGLSGEAVQEPTSSLVTHIRHRNRFFSHQNRYSQRSRGGSEFPMAAHRCRPEWTLSDFVGRPPRTLAVDPCI